jgi:hypothetical protein
LKLIENEFAGFREINGFSKQELLDIKKKISKYKETYSDDNEIKELLEHTFPARILSSYSDYISNLDKFINLYLISNREPKFKEYEDFFYIKSDLIKEINLIATNLSNLNLNVQNTKRFLKKNKYLEDYSSEIFDLQEKINKSQQELKNSLGSKPPRYHYSSYLFYQTNKIKNSRFKLKHLPENCLQWEEISDFFNYLKNYGTLLKSKGILSKKEVNIQFEFKLLTEYFNSLEDQPQIIGKELLYLLSLNNFLEQLEYDENLSTTERKNIIENLKIYIQSIIKDLIMDELVDYIEDLREMEKKYNLSDKQGEEYNFKDLFDKKIGNFLPNFVESYIKELEENYKIKSTEKMPVNEHNNLILDYKNKVELFYKKIENLKELISEYKTFLRPFDHIIKNYEKIFASLLEDIKRRKEDFIYYLKTIKNEWLRDDLRGFTKEKMDEINQLLAHYRDKFATILKEDFPQFKKIEEILNTYQTQIKEIKGEVYQKFEEYNKKNLNQIQIIKKWEENFNRTKHQASFLLTQYLMKIFKNFDNIIEKENALFRGLSEISKKNQRDEELPLNYALSGYLFGKLSQKEIKERIIALREKISNLQDKQNLYESEISKLEEILGEKIKIQEGVPSTTVQCAICHKNIDLKRDRVIKCPYCGAFFHYLCIYFWLSEYNSCPACQNEFLDPNTDMYYFSEPPD